MKIQFAHQRPGKFLRNLQTVEQWENAKFLHSQITKLRCSKNKMF